MKKGWILLLAFLLTACSTGAPEASAPSDSSVLVSQEGSSGETASVSESVPSEQPAEKSEPETPLAPPDLILQGADLGDAEVECDRFFALFDQLPEAQKVGLEMPYSSQWIMPYIQFDADLYYYIRELDLYPQWQQYHDSYYVDGRQYQKTLYQLITFFDIPREKFEELCSDSIIPDSEWDEREKDIYHLKESMVDALYGDDPYTRNLAFCARESAFVAAADGEVYSGFWMLYNTPAEALESASFTPEELTEFIENLRLPFEERDPESVSADGGNYQMPEPLMEFVEGWYTEYMELAGEKA